MVKSLNLDVSRCLGGEAGSGLESPYMCPDRKDCARYLSTKIDADIFEDSELKRIGYHLLLRVPYENCNEIIPVEEN